jgi:hypothetical protein
MFTAQNVLLVLGGWFVASIGAAAIWARVALARRRPDEVLTPAPATGGGPTGSDPDAVVAGALEGSPWLELGPLQDRVAGRKARARDHTVADSETPVVG